MPEIYSALTRVKQTLREGYEPAMTPIPRSIQNTIDPAFTIGLGGFDEVYEDGLRCPVVGCGRYFHDLKTHLDTDHKEIGGSDTVRRCLSVPRTVALRSHKLTDQMRANREAMRTKRQSAGTAKTRTPKKRTPKSNPEVSAKISAAILNTRRSVAYANLRNECEAQIGQALMILYDQLGREPTAREALRLISPRFVRRTLELFGTWENALVQCGADFWRNGRKLDSASALVPLRAFYETHGRLPFVRECSQPLATPMLPRVQTILDAFDAGTWDAAMKRAAALLDIRGGLWGLPEHAA